MECWNIGNKIGINLFKLLEIPSNPIIPLLHYYIIPIGEALISYILS
jgi:hypothetical protein